VPKWCAAYIVVFIKKTTQLVRHCAPFLCKQSILRTKLGRISHGWQLGAEMFVIENKAQRSEPFR